MAAALVDIAPADLDTLTAVCDEPSCVHAASHRSLCECSCAGAGHGAHRRAGIAAAARSLRARTVDGFTPAMLAALDTDSAF